VKQSARDGQVLHEVNELVRISEGAVKDERGRNGECRKDSGVVDEIPAAYKDIDTVIRAQTDLVEVVAHLKQVVCVKG